MSAFDDPRMTFEYACLLADKAAARADQADRTALYHRSRADALAMELAQARIEIAKLQRRLAGLS